MLKIIGGGFIAISALAVYHVFKCVERQRIEALDTFISLIRYIRDRVDLYSMPIDKILLSCKESILSRVGAEASVRDIHELLSECDAVWGEESDRILRDFADSFGKSYREQQIKLCEITAKALDEQRKRLEKEFLARRKTVAALCAAIGGMIFIALL